jgi:murein L,D-transpeptidase YafK
MSRLRSRLFCCVVAFCAILVLLVTTLACRRQAAVKAAPFESIPPSAMNVSQSRLPVPLKNPSIVVYKGKRQLELYADGELARTYRVGLGFNPIADKQREGDGATPEGEFYVFVKNSRSAYHLSLGISYPNVEDAERGLRDRLITKSQRDEIVEAIRSKKGPPQDTPLGGLIYIHGNGSQSDWTLGCVALENEEIEELFGAVEVGTVVKILP